MTTLRLYTDGSCPAPVAMGAGGPGSSSASTHSLRLGHDSRLVDPYGGRVDRGDRGAGLSGRVWRPRGRAPLRLEVPRPRNELQRPHRMGARRRGARVAHHAWQALANRDLWERLLELEGCLAGGRTAAAFAAVTIRSCVSSGWETIAQCPLETSIVSALIRCANCLSRRVESPRRSRRPDSTRAATSRRECPSRRRTWTDIDPVKAKVMYAVQHPLPYRHRYSPAPGSEEPPVAGRRSTHLRRARRPRCKRGRRRSVHRCRQQPTPEGRTEGRDSVQALM
jgi:hypothetical protein